MKHDSLHTLVFISIIHAACSTLTTCYVLTSMIFFVFFFFYFSAMTLITSVCPVLLWSCVPVHTAVFVFLFACMTRVCLPVCVCVCFVCVFICICHTTTHPRPPLPPPLHSHLPPPESQEVSVESDAALGGVAIPEISVTGVGGERMPNGDSMRLRPDGRGPPDCDALGGVSEVSPDPRGHDSGSRGQQEVRRQKSVRRMVENEGSGSASTGRSQY